MKLILAIMFVFAVNVMLFLGQTAITNINPDAMVFYNYEDSLISKFDTGNYSLNENVSGYLPDTESSVSIDDNTNIFTDSFKTIKNWFLKTTGLNYLIGILNALPSFLIAIGLPFEFAYGIGVLWHGVTLFLIIIMMRGGG